MFDIDSPFTMVVAIVLIAVGAGVIQNWIKLKHNQESAGSAEDVDALKREVRDLRERVRTLEKIVTDPDERLPRELRDL